MEHILSLFENTAESYPDKIAIAYGEERYTFAELKARAVGLAARMLAQMGMEQKGAVAVMVRRDAATMIRFLAVLYSGNFYVPIDPEMPPAKKQAILEDAQPGIILCDEEQRSLLEPLVFSAAVLDTADTDAACSLSVSYDEDDPIYMVYTSGSTGKPKGVIKSHKAVCSFVKAYAKRFGFSAEDVIGNQTPFFFDASAKDIYLMLYTGATLEVIPSELFMYPPRLILYLNEKKVTCICWVPTALCMVTQLATFKQVMPEYLKKVFFVGEVFPIKQLRKWIEALPQITYVNLYGSTELSGICCYYPVDTSREVENLPMGKALDNCEVFLLDQETGGVITEPDRIGEVCIISDALAQEYYHDPEKTAQVFVEMEGRRVLRSGDLARYDEEGNLLFSSRKDFQIKIMGRRVELGEIETIADKLPQIGRCCCLYDSEKKKIRMFCELTAGCDWNSRQVRDALKEHLSDYMVPGVVKIMDKLPLNANGKIDRTALKNM